MMNNYYQLTMKTRTEIIDRIFNTKAKLEEYERQHQELCQIDMLSSTGSNLREKINQLKGEINGLEWVIKK